VQIGTYAGSAPKRGPAPVVLASSRQPALTEISRHLALLASGLPFLKRIGHAVIAAATTRCTPGRLSLTDVGGCRLGAASAAAASASV